MANQVYDDRDQNFVLYEMLNVEELCASEKYKDFSRDVFDMTLETARKLAIEEVYPANAEADREGCRLENGSVIVPKCYHRLMKLFREGGWSTISTSAEAGGQGFPYTLYLAAAEGFIHNFAFLSYPFLAVGAAHLIEQYGTAEQKKRYMEKMYAGLWGGSMALTEPEAGSDVGSLKTRAVRQPDGSYRLSGTKIFITSADSDLFENIVNPVLARIEGDPAGTKGISIFLVPKYLVNPDGSLGRRNDYTIGGIEHKMGIKGSATCLLNLGDNGDCYGEILGEERQGMKVMFQLMNEARIGVGLQGMGTAGTAYLHALKYARERVQGTDIANFQNPDAPRVPIINHADVKRMLLWMKSHVEGMRALVYFCGLCVDRAETLVNREEAEKWHGIMEVLTPICKSYCSDIGFRVAETAIQVYGGYGYCQDYPVEQYLRDLKIASIYEGTNGIQALDLVGRKLGQKKGANFMALLGEMNKAIQTYGGIDVLKDLAADLQGGVNLLGEMGMFFARCGKAGKFYVPISNAYPFLNMMGTIVLGWLLFWQAGLAAPRLDALFGAASVNAADRSQRDAFMKENSEAAFYNGKLLSARYYLKHVLPQAEAMAKAIKSEDLSPVEIGPECFAV
ncbi:MAG TPA: acyl-CoA dehydrogenase [Spirochaetota bacterium]|nr:acyl-CoA dehydrogenase [Spirochaetota bacterium]HOD15163.1 acyl-CoA dehydrogenase [Spirochaetota bacterium]HQL83609.1 acyl-CoA dehydrogenase [Spirochaetota bacterium]